MTDDSFLPDDPNTVPRSKLSVDELVGSRLHLCRELLNLSLDDAALIFGVNAEQLRLIESGQRRVGAQQLSRIAQTLQLSIIWFFIGEPKDRFAPEFDVLDPEDQILKLSDDIAAIQNPASRLLVVKLARILAERVANA